MMGCVRCRRSKVPTAMEALEWDPSDAGTSAELSVKNKSNENLKGEGKKERKKEKEKERRREKVREGGER